MKTIELELTDKELAYLVVSAEFANKPLKTYMLEKIFEFGKNSGYSDLNEIKARYQESISNVEAIQAKLIKMGLEEFADGVPCEDKEDPPSTRGIKQ